jgi:hypothetical protein
MEVTKWLKPSERVTIYGNSAHRGAILPAGAPRSADITLWVQHDVEHELLKLDDLRRAVGAARGLGDGLAFDPISAAEPFAASEVDVGGG